MVQFCVEIRGSLVEKINHQNWSPKVGKCRIIWSNSYFPPIPIAPIIYPQTMTAKKRTPGPRSIISSSFLPSLRTFSRKIFVSMQRISIKNIPKNLPKAKKKQSQIKLALIFSLQARAREQLRVASHRRLGLCLRFEPLFRFFRSKIPSQTKPRTTATAIGRIALIEPPLLTVSTVSW